MSAMRILPTRKMQLAGRRCDIGVPVEVPESDARLALRSGWAVVEPESGAEPAAAKPRARRKREQPE